MSAARTRMGVAAAAAALALTACQGYSPSKEDLEAAAQTVDCDHAGMRLLIRFTEGEARILLPDGNRTILYQVPVTASSGVRYTNGLIELRGRGLDLELQQDRQVVRLICKPYEIPKS